MSAVILHGRKVVYMNGRYFAVTKDLDRTDRIANSSQVRGCYWDRIQRSPKDSRVLLNQR